jgi:hypothetical protein
MHNFTYEMHDSTYVCIYACMHITDECKAKAEGGDSPRQASESCAVWIRRRGAFGMSNSNWWLGHRGSVCVCACVYAPKAFVSASACARKGLCM